MAFGPGGGLSTATTECGIRITPDGSTDSDRAQRPIGPLVSGTMAFQPRDRNGDSAPGLSFSMRQGVAFRIVGGSLGG